MAAALSGSGLVVDLPIDIFEDALRSGIRAFKGKLGGIRCFLFDRTVKLVGSFLCQDFFVNEALPPKPDRVMVGFVTLDLIGAAILFRVGIGDRVSVVAVSVNFEDKGEGFLVGAVDGIPCFCADFV